MTASALALGGCVQVLGDFEIQKTPPEDCPKEVSIADLTQLDEICDPVREALLACENAAAKSLCENNALEQVLIACTQENGEPVSTDCADPQLATFFDPHGIQWACTATL